MILFLSGMGVMICLLLLLGIGYKLGQKKTTPKSNPPTKEEQVELIEQRKKLKALQRDFDNLMSYDLDKAYARKVVD